MKQVNRLDTGGRIDRSKPLGFWFNGKRFDGYLGDTLASALLANGVSLVARSWKYHRPRGVLAAGVEEPNALVQLFTGARTIPNARASEVELLNDLRAMPVNASPSIDFDWRAINNKVSALLPAGFYYKTFMASQRVWHFFEHYIRLASGLGSAPHRPDVDRYDKRHVHCEVLVVGGGIAGITAARTAASRGARVILVDEQTEPGGWLLSSDAIIDDLPAAQWVQAEIGRLAAMPEVTVMARATAFGYHDHNLVTVLQRLADHLPVHDAPPIRERLWKIRTDQVILATGAHERPFVFANNDLPGVMLANAVYTYLRRYAVRAGNKVIVFTNNDQAYETALAMHEAGASVHVIDVRPRPDGRFSEQAQQAGIAVSNGSAVVEAVGKKSLKELVVYSIDPNGALVGAARRLPCDLLAVSNGFSPVVHLHCQSGGKVRWDEERLQFVPDSATQAVFSGGACAGVVGLLECAQDGIRVAQQALLALGTTDAQSVLPDIEPTPSGGITALWRVPHPHGEARAPKQFVDFQNDVCANDIDLAIREGFESIEHIKRYTGLGFGTDQGKTGNVLGLAIAAQRLAKPVPQVGLTTFRPNYTPVSFGAIAGMEIGELFDPIRTTAMHRWHVEQGAEFEDVGQFKRAWYYPLAHETMAQAVDREVLAVRRGVGMLDASTLGKIDIQGPDSAKLLDLIYCNNWAKLAQGRCRYGLMLNENGMVFDDGVTVRLGAQRYLMHTTTGGAPGVLAWMERWLQTEWPELDVYLTSVTDHWATIALAGPKSRTVLASICHDIDFDDQAFPFMACRTGSINGQAVRVMRISFSGERAYEINVVAAHGQSLWTTIFDAGQSDDITPYGTEAMHVLRAEKGFVIVGQDTDLSVTPVDLGMAGMVSKSKDFLGKRSLSRADTARSDRLQLVGISTADPTFVAPEGAQLVDEQVAKIPGPAQGFITSSYHSPTLKRSIALALVRNGHQRLGQNVFVSLRNGSNHAARIVSPVFYDAKGERQNA